MVITTRSTVDNLVTLKTSFRDAFVGRKHLVSISFDLEKAYDTTRDNQYCQHSYYRSTINIKIFRGYISHNLTTLYLDHYIII